MQPQYFAWHKNDLSRYSSYYPPNWSVSGGAYFINYDENGKLSYAETITYYSMGRVATRGASIINGREYSDWSSSHLN